MSFKGVGITTGSPIAVRITPFMADVTGNAGSAKQLASVSKAHRIGHVGVTILGQSVLHELLGGQLCEQCENVLHLF